MYGRCTKSQRLKSIRKAHDEEGRSARAALLRMQARRLEETEGLFSEKAAELYNKANALEGKHVASR